MAEDYKPWTWETPESDESIKRSMVPRQDAYEQVNGQASIFDASLFLTMP